MIRQRTRILTDNGWVMVEKLKVGDRVASYDEKIEQMVLEKIEAIEKEGILYDLTIANTHNFITPTTVKHNFTAD